MTVQRKTHLQIEINAQGWGKVPGLKRRLEQATALTLATLPATLLPAATKAQATLLLTTDGAVHKLNREFRNTDKTTNVLSFPQFERTELVKAARCIGDIYVGDIAVAYGTVVKEAKAEGKSVLDHLTHLLIHGLLHLFGYDHDTDSKATRMERLEKDIMATLGLPDPYVMIETASKPRRSVKRKL
ncbi:MAG: rRNA maturation RNase YbeY [Alphaproteobacteria bacterium]|nr:rRNA maturation RNase YbeY [Alphaproteobacteria bacterium]